MTAMSPELVNEVLSHGGAHTFSLSPRGQMMVTGLGVAQRLPMSPEGGDDDESLEAYFDAKRHT